jgi:chitinase
MYASTKVGTNQPFVYCYGMDAGAELFGNIEAPAVFGTKWSKHYNLWSDEVGCMDWHDGLGVG